MAINFRILSVEFWFAAVNFCISLSCFISSIGSIKFLGDLFSQQYLSRKFCENKLLAKLNRFTVASITLNRGLSE